MTINLLQGDCLDLLPQVPSESVDLVLCDLPYGTTNCSWDSAIPLELLWAEWRRVCTGAVILFAQTPFDKVLGVSNLAGLRYEWIWEKAQATGHLNSSRAPLKAHENILVFYDRQPTYNPMKTTGHPRKTATNRRTHSAVYGAQTFDDVPYDSTERFPRSVLAFSKDTQTQKLHPTQKPVALCEYLIRTYTNPGDVVLDNCMGSGTTGVACQRWGRDFIGMEKDPAFFDVAQRRLSSGGLL